MMFLISIFMHQESVHHKDLDLSPRLEKKILIGRQKSKVQLSVILWCSTKALIVQYYDMYAWYKMPKE